MPLHPLHPHFYLRFQSDHFPLNFNFGVAKLSSPDILKLILDKKFALAAPTQMTQSNLTQNFLVYGSAPSNTITWEEPLISTTINTIFVKTLTIQDLQDQLLLTVSPEDFTDPTACEKLVLLTKEKGIQAIMENTTVDTINHQVSIKYLYKENLVELGENYY